MDSSGTGAGTLTWISPPRRSGDMQDWAIDPTRARFPLESEWIERWRLRRKRFNRK
jgi:hypothetical protein